MRIMFHVTSSFRPSNIIVIQGFHMRRFASQWPVASATIDYRFKSMLNGKIANLTIDQVNTFGGGSEVLVSADRITADSMKQAGTPRPP